MKRKIQKTTQQFPQISRSIPAYTIIYVSKIVVLALLAAFLAINLFPNLSAGFFSFEQAKIGAMISPGEMSLHLLLAQEYLKAGDMAGVERELLLADNLSHRPASRFPLPASSVLGANLSPLKILDKIKNEPQRIKNEIAFWEKVVSDKPDYRDAYLQLAILNDQIYRTDKAKGYLKKALEIDPNFQPARELQMILENQRVLDR